MRTSPRAGPGTGRRVARRTSGPPGSVISIAVISEGTPVINTFLAAGRDLLLSPSAPRPLRICAVRRGCVVAREPSAQAIEAGKQHPLVDVRLIQLVADLPLERRRDDHTATQIGVLRQPIIESRRRTRHQ